MKTKMVLPAKKAETFFPLLLLTGFFILLEISFFIQTNKAYLDDFNYVSDNFKLPVGMLPDILFFLLAQAVVHLSFCLSIWLVASLLSRLFQLSDSKEIGLAITLWFLGIFTILLANQYYFPNSKFSELTNLFFAQDLLTKNILFSLMGLWTILLCFALLQCIIFLFRKYSFFLIIAPLGVVLFFLFSTGKKPYQDGANELTPNIIIIGIDSLRPDFLSYFGHDKTTPFFDGFLEDAVVFSEALTPLARTFPAWTSILTGKYPLKTGARSDLSPPQNLNLKTSIATILQHHGYETIYATDETRFSNIDKNFGFDHLITPPMGINDFLLGTFNDFPISNLLVNTKVGQWLFPYSYANRPVYFTYEPNTFLALLKQRLNDVRKKPLFLAIHFCLPHYPYQWASSSLALTGIERYEASIIRMDTELSDFFALLNQRHLLDHALVVLLSDHGEAFELAGDRLTEREWFVSGENRATSRSSLKIPQFYPPSLAKEGINQSVGHGTDVLGLSQYHSVLAFKFYGLARAPKGTLPGVVSLIDINPTLVDLLHIKSETVDGISLLPFIDGIHKGLSGRHIFLESDFSPVAIRTVYPEVRQVMLQGIEFFHLDPKTLRLTVKDKMRQMIIDSKQYADIYGSWMLALYPQRKNLYTPVLINLYTGMWTTNLQSEFAFHSPVSTMLPALLGFYCEEIGQIEMNQLYTKWVNPQHVLN